MERLQISNSMLQLVFDCPTRVTMRLLGRTGTEPNASLECGRAFHEFLAEYYITGSVTSVLQISGPGDSGAGTHYREWCERFLNNEDRRWWENVARIAEEYTERYWPIDELQFTVDPERIEVEFVMPLGTLKDGTPLDMIGVLDGIVRDKLTNSLYILEHKTTGQLTGPYREGFSYDPQNTEYLWAAGNTLGEPVHGSYVDIIEIAPVPSSDRKCSKHGVKYAECGPDHIKMEFLRVDRTPAMVERWKRNAMLGGERLLKLARRAKDYGDEAATATATYGEVTGACKFCEFKAWCLTNNRSLSMIDSLAPKGKVELVQVEEPNLPLKLRSGLVEVEG